MPLTFIYFKVLYHYVIQTYEKITNITKLKIDWKVQEQASELFSKFNNMQFYPQN